MFFPLPLSGQKHPSFPLFVKGGMFSMHAYDQVLSCCDQCGGEIYFGEEYHRINGESVCDDCFETFARQLLRPFLQGGVD